MTNNTNNTNNINSANNKYSYDDVCNFIFDNHKIKSINKTNAHVFLKKYMNDIDSDFILTNLCQNNDSSYIKIDTINVYLENLLNQKNLQ